MRSTSPRYLTAENKRLVHYINHLQQVLRKLVEHGHRDPDLLADLNNYKQQLATNKQAIKEIQNANQSANNNRLSEQL